MGHQETLTPEQLEAEEFLRHGFSRRLLENRVQQQIVDTQIRRVQQRRTRPHRWRQVAPRRGYQRLQKLLGAAAKLANQERQLIMQQEEARATLYGVISVHHDACKVEPGCHCMHLLEVIRLARIAEAREHGHRGITAELSLMAEASRESRGLPWRLGRGAH